MLLLLGSVFDSRIGDRRIGFNRREKKKKKNNVKRRSQYIQRNRMQRMCYFKIHNISPSVFLCNIIFFFSTSCASFVW